MPSAPYKTTILTAMSDVLRPAGFRKMGSYFTREFPEVIHFIGLQSSQSSTSTCLRVTLNLSVWVHAAAAGDQKPDAMSAHWRERIGMLMPERNDRWWVMSSESEAELAIEEICRVLREHGLPALDGLASSDAMVHLWHSGRSPGLTARLAQRYLERLENAKTEANKTVERTGAPPRSSSPE